MWITMLAMADKNGEVHGSIPGMARLAGMALDEAESALCRLMSPDAYSRTPDNEGRRIATIPGGWEILNHGKYRLMASKEDAKAATAERVRRHRSRNGNVTQCNGNVTDGNASVTVGRDIAEAEAEADKENTPLPPKGDGEALKKPKDNLPTNPYALKVAELFRRKPTTPWSAKEIRAFKSIPKDALAELDAVIRYTRSEMAKGDNGRHRRDLLTFLNNFQGELDRARQQQKPDSFATKPIQFVED